MEEELRGSMLDKLDRLAGRAMGTGGGVTLRAS